MLAQTTFPTFFFGFSDLNTSIHSVYRSTLLPNTLAYLSSCFPLIGNNLLFLSEFSHPLLLSPSFGVFFFEIYLFIYLFIYLYLFLAALGLCCCARAFSSCGVQGLLFDAVHGLLTAVASLVGEHGF